MSRHATLEDLSGYLDTDLAEESRRRVERHVRECLPCRERLAGLRRAVGELERLDAQAPPPALGLQVDRRVGHLRTHRGLFDRLESRARRATEQPALAPVFGVVLALGVIIYLFSFAVARYESRPAGTRVVLPRAAEAPTAGPARQVIGDRREAAGRVFLWSGEAWLERGLGGAPVERRLDRPAAAGDPELAAVLAGLAAADAPVRLRHAGEVVEISPAPRN